MRLRWHNFKEFAAIGFRDFGTSKIWLLLCYVLLWIHSIDLICTGLTTLLKMSCFHFLGASTASHPLAFRFLRPHSSLKDFDGKARRPRGLEASWLLQTAAFAPFCINGLRLSLLSSACVWRFCGSAIGAFAFILSVFEATFLGYCLFYLLWSCFGLEKRVLLQSAACTLLKTISTHQWYSSAFFGL